jgi:hypothetical protein
MLAMYCLLYYVQQAKQMMLNVQTPGVFTCRTTVHASWLNVAVQTLKTGTGIPPHLYIMCQSGTLDD